IAAARAEMLADTCFQGGVTTGCSFTDRPYRPDDFAMDPNSGEALLIIDDLPRLPGAAIRFRKRIRNYYRLDAGGALANATTTWHVPTSLWNALDRFAYPEYDPTEQLRSVAETAYRMYPGLNLDNAGHGATVFRLIADTNPAQPLVLLDKIDLVDIAHADYCDASGSAAAQTRLTAAARTAADNIVAMMRANNVRYVNYSAGHSQEVIRAGWAADCGTAVPAEAVLRDKLAAYAPIYAAMFGTPGVMTAQAASDNDGPANAPYDQKGAQYYNRLRAGYFAVLDSNLDEVGRGGIGGFPIWPARANADIFLNTGVAPVRPFEWNTTPLLQLDGFGLALEPITVPSSSWVTPLLLSRLINIRFSTFPARPFDDALIADIFDKAIPASCPTQMDGRCAYQDPALHGQLEAVRLGYRPREYPGPVIGN
ncbi:MAG TPA: hypothetical protein VN029_02350, partial [Sphingomonas sp.]|nr:hypothetical protein [Sphingomonas sp.]